MLGFYVVDVKIQLIYYKHARQVSLLDLKLM